MRAARILLVLGACLPLAVSTSRGQFMINTQGPAPLLTVTTATPGSEPAPVVNTGSRLRYRRAFVITKVTVATVCPGQKFTLRLLAQTPSPGSAAGEVTLTDGMPPRDFIVGIPAGFFQLGNCVLQYTAAPAFSQGNSTELGPDSHLVTFTLVAQ